MTTHDETTPQTNSAKAQLQKLTRAVYDKGYLLSYITGLLTCYWLQVLAALLMCPLRAAGRFLKAACRRLVRPPVAALRAEWRRVKQGFTVAGERVRAARARGVFIALLQVLALPVQAAKRHKKTLCRIGNVMMPLAAGLVLVLTVQYWSNLSFGLTLEYEGQKLGYIADEKVFENAAAMVNARVYSSDENLQVREPKLTLAVVPQAAVLDEAAVCDKIIQSSGNSFAEASGLYVNGELVGALTASEDIEDLLNARLDEFRDGADRVEFAQPISVQEGLYPVSSVMSATRLQTLLDAQKESSRYYAVKVGDTLSEIAKLHGMTVEQLRRLNGLQDTDVIVSDQQLLVYAAARRLQVKSVTVHSYEQEIPYQTETQKDPNLYEGVRKVLVKGQNGSCYITEETVSLDGTVQEVKEVSKVTTREPVNQVVAVGTKKRYNSFGNSVVEGDGVATGSMAWPVPAVKRVYQGFHSGHAAIDISGGTVPIMNTPIVAADGGVVKQVNTNPNVGYGVYVLIDHGNGLSTMYAHLNSTNVVVGQKVSREQEIGRGGTTGWSTGPHLHFEVRLNGRCVNPLNYVSVR